MCGRVITEQDKAFSPTQYFSAVQGDDSVNNAVGTHPIVLFIPGIRTNAEWVGALRRYAQGFHLYPNIIQISSKRSSTITLLTKIGYRERYLDIGLQISEIIRDNPNSKISIVAHSLGTALVSDAVSQINYKFDKIIFLGSVHPRNTTNIRHKCEQLINDRGTKDIWPIIAHIARPKSYDHTGTFGFGRDGVIDRKFENDHKECTSIGHLEQFVFPALNGQPKEEQSEVKDYFNFNLVHNISAYRKIIITTIIIIFSLIASFLF